VVTSLQPHREGNTAMSDMIPQTGSEPRFVSGSHHTSEDVPLSAILGIVVVVSLLCIVSAAFLAGGMSYLQVGVDKEQAHRPALLSRLTGLYGEAGPAVIGENPVSDYRRNPDSVPALKEAQLATSDTAYGWVEPGKVARIPVSRAIAILSEKETLPELAVPAPSAEINPADAVRRAREVPAPQPPVSSSPKGQ